MENGEYYIGKKVHSENVSVLLNSPNCQIKTFTKHFIML